MQFRRRKEICEEMAMLTAHDDTEKYTNDEVPYGHEDHNRSNCDILQTATRLTRSTE